MTKWEYRWVELKKQWKNELDAEGSQGWELVSVTHFFGGDMIAFFKRALQ